MPAAKIFSLLALALALALACVWPAAAREETVPRLHTNQSYVEEVTGRAELKIDDPMAVFAYVLGSLPERVRVYPTENHYYFAFSLGGVRYAGNIKIDVRIRDRGQAHFVYYEDVAAAQGDGFSAEVTLDTSRGVTVEKLAPLAYRIAYRSKSVVFELNDLSRAKPPASAVAADETFIGPVFDESGVRFFLMFNAKLKVFHYVLDETVTPADRFAPAEKNDRILVGKRTGFAFYREHRLDRKILIGVLESSVRANTYFDGPFDQMPDNFNDGETLRKALYVAYPFLEGKIDRYGAFPDGARFVIAPYMQYRRIADLGVFQRCAMDRRVPASAYYQCFVVAGDVRGPGSPPLALEKRRRR
jgi:hypothetical protein